MKIVIIGAGIIGLSLGWQLARNGYSVEIFEKGEAGKQASWAAAGMLSPYLEAGFDDSEFLKMGISSLELYPQFLAELVEETQIRLQTQAKGTLYVGVDRDDRESLLQKYQFMKKNLMPVEWLLGDKLRAIEPFLSPSVYCGIFVSKEGQIDNRALIQSLIKALEKHGAKLLEKTVVKEVLVKKKNIKGIKLENGQEVISDIVINASGAWMNQILWPDHPPHVRPIKGQIVTLKMDNSFHLDRTIRTERVYLVPKCDGRLRVGATNEDIGFDQKVTAKAILELLQKAQKVVPAIEKLEFEETIVGFRPVLFNHQPYIAPSSLIKGLFHAIGHGRHGILLAPYTACTMIKLLKEQFR